MKRAELAFLARMWRPWWWILAIILPLTLVSTALKAGLPLVLERAFHALALRESLESVRTLALIYLGIGCVEWFLTAGLMFVRGSVNVLFEWKVRSRTFSRLVRQGPDFLQRFRTGDLVTRLTDDVAEKLSWFACSGIFRAVSAACIVLFALAMMLRIDPWLTLLSAAPLPLLILLHATVGSELDRRYSNVQTRISDLNGSLEACFAGLRVVKAFGREDGERAAFAKVAEACSGAEIKAARASVLLDTIYGHSFQAGVVAVLLAGGHAVIAGRLGLGQFIAFEAWVIMMSVPMLDLGNLLVRGRQSGVSIGRLLEIELPPPAISEPEAPTALPSPGTGRLRFEDVSLSVARADGSLHEVLRDVSFEVAPGRLVAVVGRVGAGKTMLLRLPSRLLDPTRGHVTLDGVDLRSLRPADLRRVVGLAPQEPALLSGTIRENVAFDRPWVDEAAVRWAIGLARLESDLAGFSAGLDTRVGVRGVSLSGGQAQRVALARALAGRPQLLLLDDVTSALDAETEDALWQELARELPGLALLVATHRTRTLERADRIVVLDGGRVVEDGRHAELAAQRGAYHAIYLHHVHEVQAGETPE